MIKGNENKQAQPTYSEFSDPRLVEIYDTFNSLDLDGKFFCEEIEKLSPSVVVDFGCGTGLLTTELAKRDFRVIGVEPAVAMLEVAKRKSYAQDIEWIAGSYRELNNVRADVFVMTSHVAQFFLEQNEWITLLKTVHATLEEGGHLMFDSRNPLNKPWENWTREKSSRKYITKNGEVEMWYQLVEVDDEGVLYEIHYLFGSSDEELTSLNKLVYRPEKYLTQSLTDTGFEVEKIYGDWDGNVKTESSPEMIFIAKKI